MAEADLLEWYRVDQSQRIRRVLGAGAGVLTFGALVTGITFATNQSDVVRGVASAVGLSCCVSGALTAVLGMHRALRDDAYVAVRVDGVLFEGGAEKTFLPWETVARIRFDDVRRAIVFERRDGGEYVIERAFAGTTASELAGRLDGLRRKASFSMLG